MQSNSFEPLVSFLSEHSVFSGGVVNLGAMLIVVGLLLVALMLSAYVRIVTVCSILRIGFGVRVFPSFLIQGILALSLTFFVMWPVIERGLNAISHKNYTASQQLDVFATEWGSFLEKHTLERYRQGFVELVAQQNLALDLSKGGAETAAASDQGIANSESTNSVNSSLVGSSWRVIIPAFVLSELDQAFSMGLRILLPFLLIDLLLGVIVAMLGLETLDLQFVALPLKLFLFVYVDGWMLISKNLIESY